MKTLVTGATGFIGKATIAALARRGHSVVAAVRAAGSRIPDTAETVAVGDIGPDTDWRAALAGCDAVVHLAARVHVLRETQADAAAFHAINVAGTLNLARQAAQAGVRRLVFLSSIKVNGEGGERAYRAGDAPQPQGAYAVSKHEAKTGLATLARETGLEVVVLRPPLVYGPGVGANFRSLLGAVACGWPLPLASVDNRRSLIYLGNLVDVIERCLLSPEAAGQTFLVSDGEALSTPQLIRAIARALGRSPRLIPLPPGLLRLAGRMTGRGDAVMRLTASLALDDGHVWRTLRWTPPYTLAQGLAATVAALREDGRGR